MAIFELPMQRMLLWGTIGTTEIQLHAEMDRATTPDNVAPPINRRFMGGVTPIDIFKTNDPIDTKKNLGKLQQFFSSEKNFRGL